MPQVLIRKNITLIGSFISPLTEFSENIQVPFQPDEIIIKGISICTSPTNVDRFCLLQSNLIKDQYIMLLPLYQGFQYTSAEGPPAVFSNAINNTFYPLDLHYTCDQPINSNYTLKVTNPFTLTNSDVDFDICVNIEFVKYKNKSPY